MQRRNFLLNTFKAGMMGAAVPLFSSCGAGKGPGSPSLDRIELFRYDINTPRHFSWGTWYNRQHIFMKISSGDHCGWAEVAASKNTPDLDVKAWGGFLRDFKKLSISEAYQLVKANQTGSGKDGRYHKRQLEFVEMALLDLMGRIVGKPAVEILGMPGTKAIPGIFCILNKDPEKIEENIHRCKKQNLDDYVKFKMFGEKALDLGIVQLARSLLKPDAFVLSDANRGYGEWDSLDELALILRQLHQNGLDAMEDPAELTNEQWIGLQNKVGQLALVPDYAIRPAWKGIERVTHGMGRFFNLHPETMGSFNHLKPLAAKIKAFGGKVVIGDASLVGPACSVWQQIGIGLEASWVEAIEKADESDAYLQCITSKATYRDDEGYYAFKPEPGFGLHIDAVLLKEICHGYENI